jgi:Glycosyl hydrolase family 76
MPESDYLSHAVTAAGVLTNNWFSSSAPSQWVPADYWRTPVICTLLTDLMTQTDQVNYTATLENARDAGEGYLTSCGYYDDLTWWGRFFMHACNYFKNQSKSEMAAPYLQDAEVVCDQLSEAWDEWNTSEYCSGGVWWKRPPPPPPGPPLDPSTVFKASNSTFGFMETALALYLELGDQKYLDMGQKAWEWIAKWQFVDDKGLVWGALIPGECKLDPKNEPVLSLQGEALAPLWMLYQATENIEYLDVADKVAQGTISNMVWSGTQIMQDRDDAAWAGHSDDWKRDNSGDTPFKGLFATYLGEYTKNLSTLSDPVRQQKAATYAAFLRANADAVWTNYPGTMFSMDWHTLDKNYQPIPDADYVNASLQYSGVCALAAAALVSS